MSVLVDTGVLVAGRYVHDPFHGSATQVLSRAARGEWGRAFVSDYIVDEAVTLMRARSRRHDATDDFASFLLGEPPYPRTFSLLAVDPATFGEARRLLHQYADRDLSFTDCTSIALVRSAGLDGVLSFDRGLDGLVPRIEPTA